MRFKTQTKIIDEFAFVLLGALIFIGIMLIFWTTPQEVAPSIEPRTISLRIIPNTQKTITFKIIGNLSSINLEANGTLSQIISFSENNFNVNGEKEVKAVLKAPIGYDRYEGYIIARGKGGEDAVQVFVYVVPYLTLTSRSISINDFKVFYYGDEKIVDTKSDFVVEKSLFSSKEARLVFSPERMDIEEAKIKIIISGVRGSGYLVVKLNGNTILKKKAREGFEEVSFNKSDVREMNFITIEVENEGFGILSKTSYNIYEAKVIIKYKSSPYSFELSLSPHEIDNFYSLEFSSVLVQQNNPAIEMRINNQKVFIGNLPISIFKINITKDLLGNELLLYPINNISISLLSEGEIYFSNNIIKVYSYSS